MERNGTRSGGNGGERYESLNLSRTTYEVDNIKVCLEEDEQEIEDLKRLLEKP